MTNIKKILFGIIIVLTSVITITINAEEKTVYEQFIENISNASTSHLIVQSYNKDYLLDNANMSVYAVISEKDKELSLNILFVKKSKDVFLRISNGSKYTNYYSDDYGIIYNIKVSYNLIIYIDIARTGITGPLDSASILTPINYEDYASEKIVTTNGLNDFPENKVKTQIFSLDNIFNLFIIVGLVVCIILGVVILLLVKNKKVNIRREEYFEQPQNQEEIIIINNDIYEHVEPKVEEIKQESVYSKDYLRNLYQKKFNGEITDAEFDLALKKYLTAKDYEEDDE